MAGAGFFAATGGADAGGSETATRNGSVARPAVCESVPQPDRSTAAASDPVVQAVRQYCDDMNDALCRVGCAHHLMTTLNRGVFRIGGHSPPYCASVGTGTTRTSPSCWIRTGAPEP